MLQHSGLENRSAQNIFKILKIVDTCILCRTLCKTWKQIKFRKKIIWRMIFEWGHSSRFCPGSNIIHQTMKIMHRYGPHTKFPDYSLTLIANYKIPWLAMKFPDFSLTLRKTWNSLTFPWPWQPWWNCDWFNIRDHFVHASDQSEKTLQRNVVSHWLSTLAA